ncbi:MAG TPA: PaaX family transcriptional regulator C-terminal domain-containing protein [Limnobacter sp.]|uniref:PaaX family transcriptional regulator C-terminal domain-containing protein n=1 Tax=Limnobacter sp. TaxID=2003368 RepID=UPI002EDA7274
MRKPTAKSLILDLLLANQGQPISAKQAIAACGIFDISVNNTRVALVRLSAEGLVESAGRAMYQLTEDAHTLADDVATWRTRSKRIRAWDGTFIVVQAEKLSRNEAKQQRARARALLMLGFQPLNEHLFIRPNNIEDSLEAVRKRLYKLGLEKDAPVFGAQQFDTDTAKRITKLWNPRELEQTYSAQTKKIRTWLDRYQDLETEEAARESFLMGGAAIKHVVYDPFLPSEWLDTAARDVFLATVDELDRVGMGIWTALWQSQSI